MIDAVAQRPVRHYQPPVALPDRQTAECWVQPKDSPFQPTPKAIAKDLERQWRGTLPGHKGVSRVGIVCDDESALKGPSPYIRYFLQAVLDSGGEPRFLFPSRDVIARQMNGIDALLIPGGADVDPSFYHEARNPLTGPTYPEDDAFALSCINTAYQKNMPMLGICRGLQLMNVAAGGTLIQDLPTEYKSPLGIAVDHRPPVPPQEPDRNLARSMPVHEMIITEPRSELHELLGTRTIGISSLHHQAIKQLGSSLYVTAIAPDGVIEAIERKDVRGQIGVQGHPELSRRFDARYQRLFDSLVANGASFRRETHAVRAANPPAPTSVPAAA